MSTNPDPSKISSAEWEIRKQLSSLYHIAAEMGWDELIYNHISARVPQEDALLINNFGLHYSEVTPSNLVKINMKGEIINGPPDATINAPGLVIHTAIHAARPDLECVIHHHEVNGLTVATLAEDFMPITQNSCIVYPKISKSKHAYEGVAVSEEERKTLVDDLGDKEILLLPNHGVIVGGLSIPYAYFNAYVLHRACVEHVTLLSAAGGDRSKLIHAKPTIVEQTNQLLSKALDQMGNSDWGQLEFKARVRILKKTHAADEDVNPRSH
eukprot:TRINITY_DN12786_c0_g1_i1.p1 TRINITY_DN12786_c0_g1~~TRINITY_DN12786_c0_g1_i1.p1  ORF type:complete len:269 (+),score=45.91 TRINITY_DN12786_c0_g1_i1:50-856(+)